MMIVTIEIAICIIISLTDIPLSVFLDDIFLRDILTCGLYCLIGTKDNAKRSNPIARK